jgi:hypothetical protein
MSGAYLRALLETIAIEAHCIYLVDPNEPLTRDTSVLGFECSLSPIFKFCLQGVIIIFGKS